MTTTAAATNRTDQENGEFLVVDSLAYAFPDGRQAIDGVSFRVAAGETVGLIGSNGAGKTTLIHLMAGLVEPTAGSVEVFGERLDGKGSRDARRRLGVVFQETEDQLFNATVFDDVAFGPLHWGLDAESARRQVEAALDEVGLNGFEDRVPQHLSSGERRRVALAGVLACRPDVLLLDEPTSDLDPRERRRLTSLLASTQQARIVASHDFEFVLCTCTRVLLLEAGRLCADGQAVDVLSDRALLEQHGLELPLGLRGLSADGLRRLIETGDRDSA